MGLPWVSLAGLAGDTLSSRLFNTRASPSADPGARRLDAGHAYSPVSPVTLAILTDLLSPDRIKIPLQSGDKPGVIAELSEFLADGCELDSNGREEILRAVLAREEVLSTGIGGGLAIPHGRSEAIDQLVLVAGRTAEPIDFGALDGRPVQIILLLVGPESESDRHIKVLSRIGRLLRSKDVRNDLIAAESSAAFYDVLKRAEKT